MGDPIGHFDHQSSGSGHSFFDVFQFSHLMHDAIDGGLVYEGITILRDIETSSGLKLKQGDYYESLWFLFATMEFQFINWEPKFPNAAEYIPDDSSVFIPQSELAPFLVW